MRLFVSACLAATALTAAFPSMSQPATVGLAHGALSGPGDEMSASEHQRIMEELSANRERLIGEGKLSRFPQKALTNFAWPLRQAAGRTDPDYFGISNYVDEDPTFPSHVLDYQCGTRTYDLASGYNHQGTDIFIWPWAWKKMDDQDVVIQAGAPGTIIGKTDGNFDRSCAIGSGTWNSVYVQHADGSVAWYGHMKSGSPTVKTVGDAVAVGEYLGTVGSSGSSTGPHLHLELYDASNQLVDPWQINASCNVKSKQVKWASERPYRDPVVNLLTVGTTAPVFPACPGDETTNASDYIPGGVKTYFTAYLRDQTLTQNIGIRILRPDSTVLWSTTGVPGQDYNASYWSYYYDPLPNISGTWTFEVTFNSKVYTKTFLVTGSIPSNGAPDTFTIQPGSSQSTAPNAVFPGPIAVLVKDALGVPVKATVTFTLPTSGATAIMDSPTALTDANGLASVGLRANKNVGSYNATVSVTGIVGSQTVALTNGTQLLSANAPTLDFGGQSMNTTSPALASTITNTTGSPVAITGVTASAGYGVTHNCPAPLPASGSCTVTVTFTPTAASATAAQPGQVFVSYSGGGPSVVSLTGIAEKSLVTHYYRSILRRAPDAPGKDFWEGEATRMQGLGANVNETWFAMAMYFYFSAEYLALNRNDTGFVTDLYGTFFNRAPDSGGLNFWVAQIASGMPREVVLAGFMFSPEFGNFTQAIFGNTAVRAEVNMVMDFYRGLLARLPDNDGFAAWVANFRTAQCQGGAQVSAMADSISSSFVTSGEYAGKGRTDPQYVGDLYNSFLRRGGDLAGVQYWINQLATAALNRNQVRQNFVASAEFSGRVTSVINQGCSP